MAKLKLDLDRITVESFDPSPEDEAARGTVQGLDTGRMCPSVVPPNCPSRVAEVDCPQSYYGTCQSCGNTCAGCTITCPTNGVECWETS
jgi:hypothetical protein